MSEKLHPNDNGLSICNFRLNETVTDVAWRDINGSSGLYGLCVKRGNVTKWRPCIQTADGV